MVTRDSVHVELLSDNENLGQGSWNGEPQIMVPKRLNEFNGEMNLTLVSGLTYDGRLFNRIKQVLEEREKLK